MVNGDETNTAGDAQGQVMSICAFSGDFAHEGGSGGIESEWLKAPASGIFEQPVCALIAHLPLYSLKRRQKVYK
jgi:hypothetical protein